MLREESTAILYKQGSKSAICFLLNFRPTVMIRGGTHRGVLRKSAFLADLAEAGRLATKH